MKERKANKHTDTPVFLQAVLNINYKVLGLIVDLA